MTANLSGCKTYLTSCCAATCCCVITSCRLWATLQLRRVQQIKLTGGFPAVQNSEHRYQLHENDLVPREFTNHIRWELQDLCDTTASPVSIRQGMFAKSVTFTSKEHGKLTTLRKKFLEVDVTMQWRGKSYRYVIKKLCQCAEYLLQHCMLASLPDLILASTCTWMVCGCPQTTTPPPFSCN